MLFAEVEVAGDIAGTVMGGGILFLGQRDAVVPLDLERSKKYLWNGSSHWSLGLRFGGPRDQKPRPSCALSLEA